MNDREIEIAKEAILTARKLGVPFVLNLNLSQQEWQKVWNDVEAASRMGVK